MQVSVVVPVRNESENIAPLVSEIRAALEDRFDYEIVYVDDGSTDGTLAALQEARALVSGRLRILQHPRSSGQSTAIWNGVKAARAPVIATLDGDGQNDPADIPALLVELALGRDADLQLVTGHRAKRNDNALRRLSSRIANSVRSAVLKDNTPDTGCGIKVFYRAAYLQLPYFDHMHRFIPALIQRQGGGSRSVAVSHRARRHGKSNYGVHNRLWAGIVDLMGVAWLMRREKRTPLVREIAADGEVQVVPASMSDQQSDAKRAQLH